MQYAKLKKADITVSRIGFGTNAVGGHNLYENIDDADGVRMIETAYDLGINYFDTADAYGIGRSEEILGDVLKGKRDKTVIATKGGIEFLKGGGSRMNNQPAYLRKALEESLFRLKGDYVDIYYIHWPDNVTPIADAMEEMVKLRDEGKIRAIGVSNFSLDQLKEANAYGDVVIAQLPYNMLDRATGDDILPYCVDNGISFAPYGPLAYGILGGKYTKSFRLDKSDWRNDSPLFDAANFEANIDRADKLKMIAEEKGTSLPNLALAWLLHQDGIDAVIPGGKRKDQAASNAAASDVVLSKEEMAAIREILV